MSGNTAESGFTPRRLVIVGCRGRMGTLLSARWSAAGHTVAGLDLPLTDEAFAEALPGADAVFLCIPAGAMAEALPHLVPHLDGRQILADITSVKMQPLGQMERAYAGPVVGTHPLFGPKPQPSDLRVCITPGAAATDTHIGLVEGLFKDMGMLDLPFDRRGPRQCRRVDSGVELHFQSGVFCDACRARGAVAFHNAVLPAASGGLAQAPDRGRPLVRVAL